MMRNKIFALSLLSSIFFVNAQSKNDSIAKANKKLIEDLKKRIDKIENTSLATGSFDSLMNINKIKSDSISLLLKKLKTQNEKVLADKYNSSKAKFNDLELNKDLKNNSIVLSQLGECNCFRLFYNANQTKLDYSKYKELDSIATIILANPKARLKLIGHADKTGNESSNITLSRERVLAIKDYFEKTLKVSFKRVITEWHGSALPIQDTNEDDKQFLNRRLEVFIEL